ncbi:MAG: hypothetical protein M3O70_03925 [Actinomycetota bacterium]|nr:hypothetical protein [Actinomycetota bacterium]
MMRSNPVHLASPPRIEPTDGKKVGAATRLLRGRRDGASTTRPAPVLADMLAISITKRHRLGRTRRRHLEHLRRPAMRAPVEGGQANVMDAGASTDAAQPGPVTKLAAVASAATQLGALLVLLRLGVLSDGVLSDRLKAVPLVAVYGLPALLAILALRGRDPLLLAAGVASLALAVFPFSLHSFVFGPVGLIYLLLYAHLLISAKWRTHRHSASRSAVAALVVPLLLVIGFFASAVHDDPVCYTKRASGEITINRDPVASGEVTINRDRGGMSGTITGDVVERGCSSDTVVWWEAATSIALSAAALTTALLLIRPRSAEADAQH